MSVSACTHLGDISTNCADSTGREYLCVHCIDLHDQEASDKFQALQKVWAILGDPEKYVCLLQNSFPTPITLCQYFEHDRRDVLMLCRQHSLSAGV